MNMAASSAERPRHKARRGAKSLLLDAYLVFVSVRVAVLKDRSAMFLPVKVSSGIVSKEV